MFRDVTTADIFRAAERIRPIVNRTPLRHCQALSHATGKEVFLKLESEQVTGSFKLRGAGNTVATLTDEERRAGVVASSAGNHGLGVAFAARHHGVSATIFVPSTAPSVKKEGIAALGATVDDSAPDYDAAMVLARRHAEEHGTRFINPCVGDPLLAGQGTVALEILEDLPGVASVVVPVGGGGLLGGTGIMLRNAAPDVRIAGAQSVETSAMSQALEAGRLVDVTVTPTLADGLAGQIDEEALEIGRYALDEIVTVSESDIANAIAWLHANEQVKAEGAGAVGVAALLSGKLRELPSPIVVVISGGNIDASRLDEILSSR